MLVKTELANIVNFFLLIFLRRKNEDLDEKRRKNRLIQDTVSEQIKSLQVHTSLIRFFYQILVTFEISNLARVSLLLKINHYTSLIRFHHKSTLAVPKYFSPNFEISNLATNICVKKGCKVVGSSARVRDSPAGDAKLVR